MQLWNEIDIGVGGVTVNLAYVFPGQGAQYVGMGKELADNYQVAREVFDEADDALGFPLSRLIWEGPEEKLRLTYHTQPALLATSVAAYRVFAKSAANEAKVCAGHSLGEYSALVAVGALSFRDAIQLVQSRGQFMDDAVPAGKGAMSAVLGLEASVLRSVCEEASVGEEIVELANVNCPGQIAISGTVVAVERAGELAKKAGARRVIPLVVSGPFHCRLMKPAARKLAEALAATPLQAGLVPVVANVDALPRTLATEVRGALEQQLYKPVLWHNDVQAMVAMGASTFIEFGPGTVLSGLIRKINKNVRTFHVEDCASLEETLAAI